MTAELLQRFQTLRDSGMLGQLIRFGIVGVISSAIYSAVYLPLTWYYFPGVWAFAAVPFAFAIAVSVGFPLHSLWSFRGHGQRDSGGRQHAKFVLVQGSGLLLNLGFTGVLTGAFHMPSWVPLVPAVTLVPLVTFWINRQWVFG